MSDKRPITCFGRNSFMHPRNGYMKPLDFKELAAAYPNITEHVKISLSGQASYNFKNPIALAELTKTLLLRDFDINVTIPQDKLVPTLPLRLNYILWIEDLLNCIKDLNNIQVYGIDIGTGASCIYPLLAAKKGWKMLATEIDKSSAKTAIENVDRNYLNGSITVKIVEESENLLKSVINQDINYHFCMCNPPFFEMSESPQNRSGRRPPPKNSATGIKGELEASGGEVEFIRRILKDSLVLREKILIYTTMIGKKEDFNILLQEITKAEPLSISTTEFHQGRVTRWAIAWSFNVQLNSTGNIVSKNEIKKTVKPLLVSLDPGCVGETLKETVLTLLTKLQMTFEIEQGNPFTCSVSAFEDRWSHQRRKKRALKRKLEESDEGPLHKEGCIDLNLAKTDEISAENCTPSSSQLTGLPPEYKEETCDLDGLKTEVTVCAVKSEPLELENMKKQEKDNDSGNVPILEFTLKIAEENKCLEFLFLSGSAGKNGLHQVSQYFKNNLKL